MPNSASTLFRERLKELRRERKLTQEQAAEKIGIPAKVYQFYELGVKKNPGLNTLERICEGFAVTLEEFFGGGAFASRNRKASGKSKGAGLDRPPSNEP